MCALKMHSKVQQINFSSRQTLVHFVSRTLRQETSQYLVAVYNFIYSPLDGE